MIVGNPLFSIDEVRSFNKKISSLMRCGLQVPRVSLSIHKGFKGQVANCLEHRANSFSAAPMTVKKDTGGIAKVVWRFNVFTKIKVERCVKKSLEG